MRIGIITLHRVYNYGSVLQAYATQKIMQNLGHDAFIIDYITAQRTKRKILFSSSVNVRKNGLHKAVFIVMKMVSILLKEFTFGSFVRKNLNLSEKYITEEDLEKNPPDADIFVTGSDQTWNSDYNEGVDRGFFLSFAPEKATKVSFVSSFGKDKLDKNEIDITKKYIDKYDALSVREEAAVRIIANLGRSDAIQLIDPTLQISKEEWQQLASPRLLKEPYLVLMLLYNEDNHATEYARKIADELKLKLVKISWEMKKPKEVDRLFTHRSPADFLSLFSHAEYIVTNSFHGLAFAINFEKQFIILPRLEYNSRIESLLNLTGLQNRMITTPERICEYRNVIQYERINRIIKNERERATNFLLMNLHEKSV